MSSSGGKEERVLVAVYGTLRKGGRWHYLLEGSTFIGEGVTPPNYTMLLVSGGNFPYLIDEGTTAVTVEVYEVSRATLKRLDALEGVPTHYRAASTAVDTTPDQRHGTGYVALIYVASEETKAYLKRTKTTVVESGDWKTVGIN